MLSVIRIGGLAAIALAMAVRGHTPHATPQEAARRVPVGLAIEIDNGAATPLRVARGQAFYLEQLDLRAATVSDTDEGVGGLARRGDFASLAWNGVLFEEAEPVLLPNPDRTFTRRRFYRGAAWIGAHSTFRLEQLDARGRIVGTTLTLDAGIDSDRRAADDFFTRRFRAIQWTRDCRALDDCRGATRFEQEALVELRHARHPDRTFTLTPQTTALRLHWSLRPQQPYLIPVTQVEAPPFAYGASVGIETLTPPRADGSYAPGSDITFRLTLKDGAGRRLHPVGALPSYDQVMAGTHPAGIQYYRAFFDPTTTYWRRKHRERMLMATFLGPAQHAQAIRQISDLEAFVGPDDVQVTGRLETDGVHAEVRMFPTARDLFGGAIDPAHAGWSKPVPDTWTHHVPDTAPAGTYFLNVKGRRTYLGEDVPFSRTITIQVGTPRRTQAMSGVDPNACGACHLGSSALDRINHANANLATCAGCHVPLGFELEGPIAVRTHFIHARSHRVGAPLDRCATCHATRESTQRISKAACLSCHTSYPASHVQQFGPIQSIYVGGGRESFQPCTSSCHQTHPDRNRHVSNK